MYHALPVPKRIKSTDNLLVGQGATVVSVGFVEQTSCLPVNEVLQLSEADRLGGYVFYPGGAPDTATKTSRRPNLEGVVHCHTEPFAQHRRFDHTPLASD